MLGILSASIHQRKRGKGEVGGEGTERSKGKEENEQKKRLEEEEEKRGLAYCSECRMLC